MQTIERRNIISIFQDVCTGIAVGLHYIFLVDFALMLGEGIQVAIMVVIIFRTTSIIQWLIPSCWSKH